MRYFKKPNKLQTMYEIISDCYLNIFVYLNEKSYIPYSSHLDMLNVPAYRSSLYLSESNILFEKLTCENYAPLV